jgi:malate dehydrogenase
VNGGIFGPQGEAINDHAASACVLVVGNPATPCLIAQPCARCSGRPVVRHDRLDENRAERSSPSAGVPVRT